MSKNQHIVPNSQNWSIKWEWNSKYTKNFDTQKQAIEYGKNIAKNQKSELIIHRPNGQIRSKDSYWKDPYPPKW